MEAGPAEAAALGNLLVQTRTMKDPPGDVSIRDVVRSSCELKVYEPDVILLLDVNAGNSYLQVKSGLY